MPAEDFIKEIAAGDLKKVQERLKKEKPNQKYTDPKEKTTFYSPLHAAVKAKKLAIVEALLGAAADVGAVDQDEATPLHWCSLHNDKDAAAIAEALLKKKAKVDALTKSGRLTPLHLAAARGAAAIIPVLAAAAGAAGLESLAPGYTPLIAAVREGHAAAVDALIAAGAKLGTQDAAGMTALMHLVKMGRLGEARALLVKGDCNLNAQATAEPCHSALMMLVMGQQAGGEEGVDTLGLIEELLAKGASPDLQDSPNKNTPIMAAIQQNNKPLALRLLKASKQVDLRNKARLTTLGVALSAGADDEVIGAVLAAGANVASEGPGLLKGALESKRDGLTAELIKVMKPAQLDTLNVNFKSMAAAGMPKAALAYLVRFDSEQSDKHPIDDDGNTNLHLVAEHGAPYDLVAGLIKLGLGPNTANKSGDTPLHVAARCGHVEVCRALLDGGADALKRNGKNRRAREQPKIPDCTRNFLADAEEEAKERKANKQSELWDDKMKATQTESAFGLRVV